MSDKGYIVIDEVLRLDVTDIQLVDGAVLFLARGLSEVAMDEGHYQFVLYGPDHRVFVRNRFRLDQVVPGEAVGLRYRITNFRVDNDRWEAKV